MKKKEEALAVIEAFKKASVDLIDLADKLCAEEQDYPTASRLSHTTDYLEAEIYDPHGRYGSDKKELQRLEDYVNGMKEG